MQNFIIILCIIIFIGYVRVGLAFLACYLWLTHPLTVALIFVMSQMVLDDLDGIAARRFNQGHECNCYINNKLINNDIKVEMF